jgi:hypothetical protein
LAKVVQGVSQKDDVLLDWRHKDDGAIGTKRGVNSWRSPTKSMYVSLFGGFLEDVIYGVNGNKKNEATREGYLASARDGFSGNIKTRVGWPVSQFPKLPACQSQSSANYLINT